MRRAATAVLGSAVATVLALIRPHPVALGHQLLAPGATLHRTDPDAVIAELSASLLWLGAAWLALGIAVTVLASVPGRAGQVFGAASRRLLPAALRRVVAGSAGLGVLLAPIPAAVATHAGLPPRAAAATLPAPTWPGAPTPAIPPDPPPTVAHPVRVRPGDSLWLITAHRLGPAADPATIAATWPRWYAANRAVIGPDPNLILPGQELTSPDGPPVDGARR